MIQSESGIFEGDGGTVLRWQTWFPDEPVGRLVLVHGLGEHLGRYSVLAGALAGRGLAVFTFDLRGHGRSTGPRGHTDSFDALVRDLVHARRESRARLPGDLPEAVLGHSLGGLIVLSYLTAGRSAPEDDGAAVAAAVVSAPWLATKTPIPAWLSRIASAVERVWPGLPLPSPIDPTLLTRDEGMQEAYRDDPLVHRRISPRMVFEVERAQSAVLRSERELPVPSMVLIPGADGLVDSAVTQGYASRLEGQVTIVELPGLRHEPFNEVEREEVTSEVGDWLIRSLRTGPGQSGSSSPESQVRPGIQGNDET